MFEGLQYQVFGQAGSYLTRDHTFRGEIEPEVYCHVLHKFRNQIFVEVMHQL